MNPDELLDRLHEQGVSFALKDGGVRVEGPNHILTPQLREELKKKKKEILSIVSERPMLQDVARCCSPPRNIQGAPNQGGVYPPEKRATAQHRPLTPQKRRQPRGRKPRVVEIPAPQPPQELDPELVAVLRRFAAHGTRPASDELREAIRLEEEILRWRRVLNELYRGRVTIHRTPDDSLQVFSRRIQ